MIQALQDAVEAQAKSDDEALHTQHNCQIQLQFVAEPGFSSALIGWFSAGDSRSRVSHVDALLPDGSLLGARPLVDGAITGKRGVQVRHPDYVRFTRQIVATIGCTAAEREAFYRFLVDQIGKPYDWRCIAGFVSGRDWREDDAWICSELIARALEVALVVPKLYLDANRITPVSLALTVSAIGEVKFEEVRPGTPRPSPKVPVLSPLPVS